MRTKCVAFMASVTWLGACDPAQAPGTELSPLSVGCCGATGLCVPASYVSADLGARLPLAECEEEGAVCAPVEWVFGASSTPLSCRTKDDLEGRCMPSCMPELEPRLARLQQQSCGAGYLCVPCFDPLTGEDTEACHIEADPGPSEPAPALEPCAGGDSRCVKRASLASLCETDLRQLGANDCAPEEDMLCVPEALLAAEDPLAAIRDAAAVSPAGAP